MTNIVIVVMDCLRADHVSCYGYYRKTTPNIDSIATLGTKFTRAFTQSTFTVASAGSILTGMYPSVHGATSFFDKLSLNIPTLPDILKNLGFRTALFSGMPLISEEYGLTRGFDEPHFSPYRVKLSKDSSEVRADQICKAFLSWIRENKGKEFFSLIWFSDAHFPYHHPPFKAFCSSTNPFIDLYDSGIRYADWYIGKVVSKLKEWNLYDDTILIVTGDHGDIFSEHYFLEGLTIGKTIGRLIQSARHYVKSGKVYEGHAVLPYDEVIRVPLVIKFPRDQFRKMIFGGQVQLIDLLPTIIDCTNTDVSPSDRHWQGLSLLSLLNPEAPSSGTGRTYVFCETKPYESRHGYVSIRTPRFKLIKKIGRPAFELSSILQHPVSFFASYLEESRKLFFSRSNEKTNLSELSIYSNTLQELNLKLHEWMGQNKKLRQKFSRGKFEMTDYIKSRLESLGYI